MGTHTISIVQEKESLRWRAFCKCKAGSEFYPTEGDAKVWKYRHEKLVEQARAHLRDKTPTVLDQFKWYTMQATNPNLSSDDREQWQMLADGLARRATPIQSTETDLPLPFEVERLYRQPNRKGSQ